MEDLDVYDSWNKRYAEVVRIANLIRSGFMTIDEVDFMLKGYVKDYLLYCNI